MSAEAHGTAPTRRRWQTAATILTTGSRGADDFEAGEFHHGTISGNRYRDGVRGGIAVIADEHGGRGGTRGVGTDDKDFRPAVQIRAGFHGQDDSRVGDLRTVVALKTEHQVVALARRGGQLRGVRQRRIAALEDKLQPIGHPVVIRILVDDVNSVTMYSKDDIDKGAQSSNESQRDIIGVIRKHKKDGGGKKRSVLVIWLDIRKVIGRVEKDL